MTREQAAKIRAERRRRMGQPDVVVTNYRPQPFHPYCPVCGWRKGGVDSWDGKSCKCRYDNYEPPIKLVEG